MLSRTPGGEVPATTRRVGVEDGLGAVALVVTFARTGASGRVTR
jgi:hypothetical protein